jgi:hypothetical protein
MCGQLPALFFFLETKWLEYQIHFLKHPVFEVIFINKIPLKWGGRKRDHFQKKDAGKENLNTILSCLLVNSHSNVVLTMRNKVDVSPYFVHYIFKTDQMLQDD